LAALGLRMPVVVGVCGVAGLLITAVAARMWSSADGAMEIDGFREAS
jgi:hypothetical protein